MVDETKDPSSSDGELDEELDSDLDLDKTEDGEEEEDSSKPGKKNAAARINELVAEVKQTRAEMEKLRAEQAKPAQTASTTQSKELTPESQKAVEYLKGLGFTRAEDIEQKVKAIEDRIALDNEHSRLGSSYDGSDGRPKYDKAKVEEYMRSHAVYDPEIAYKAMNETELLDWHSKKSKTGNQKAYVEKPGASGSNRGDANSITREKLAEVAANPTPDNRAWYERNRNKILSLMAEGQL